MSKSEVYNSQGAASSVRVGNANLTELVTGIELCDDEQSVIVVGETF
ncbi:MAG: hypothetical protein R3B47_21165 [Bacteroidia bacterium]